MTVLVDLELVEKGLTVNRNMNWFTALVESEAAEPGNQEISGILSLIRKMSDIAKLGTPGCGVSPCSDRQTD